MNSDPVNSDGAREEKPVQVAGVLETWYARLGQPGPAHDTTAREPTSRDNSNGDTSLGAIQRMLLSVSRAAMACEFEVLQNQFQFSQGAEKALAALDLIEQLENKFSVYKAHSDLSQLNRFGALRPVTVAVDTLALLQLAQDIHALTEGAFDITAGSLSEAWGFARRKGAVPTAAEIQQALDAVGSQYLSIDCSARQVTMTRAGVKTNPGGIGKGYALDRAARQLAEAGISDFMMHGGLSSVIARGNRQHPESGGGWIVSLCHPWRHEERLGTIRLRDAALATSGSGKQFFHFGGQRYSHIIDPRSGWPSQGVLSVTVICPSGAVADALATGLFVLGEERTSAFCRQYPSVCAIVVGLDESGRTSVVAHNASEDLWCPAVPS